MFLGTNLFAVKLNATYIKIYLQFFLWYVARSCLSFKFSIINEKEAAIYRFFKDFLGASLVILKNLYVFSNSHV